MKLLWVRARAFVHATEDEDKVRGALLWLLALQDAPRAADTVERKKAKGHHGNTIVVLEAAVKGNEARAALDHALGDGTRAAVADSLLRRLDDDGVLHVRLDKQRAVLRTVQLAETSDAVVLTAKIFVAPGTTAVKAWHEALTTSEP